MRKIGIIKNHFRRGKELISFVIGLFVFAIFVKTFNLPWWIYLVMVPLTFIIYFIGGIIDKKSGTYADDIEYTVRQNRLWMDQYKIVKDIYKLTKEINENLREITEIKKGSKNTD